MNSDKNRVRDYVQHSSHEKLSAHIEQKCKEFELLAETIWNKTHLGDACRVLPNMLSCIARQLRILNASMNLPIEVAAGACRTVFELNLRTRFMISHLDYIREFAAERAFEEISITKSFIKLIHEDTPNEFIKPLEERIEEIKRITNKWKMEKPKGKSTKELAKDADLVTEYETLYNFYSKYTHGSAWLVNSSNEQRDGEPFRNIFFVKTQIYAFDSYKRIEDFVREHEKID